MRRGSSACRPSCCTLRNARRRSRRNSGASADKLSKTGGRGCSWVSGRATGDTALCRCSRPNTARADGLYAPLVVAPVEHALEWTSFGLELARQLTRVLFFRIHPRAIVVVLVEQSRALQISCRALANHVDVRAFGNLIVHDEGV